MKLFSKKESKTKTELENKEILDTNIRLRATHRRLLRDMNESKADYGSDKIRALREFNEFCRDLTEKKNKLLGEYKVIEEMVEKRKEVYYGMITKQDELEERIYQNSEREKKIDLRERFVEDLEKKWMTKNGR